MNTSWLLRTTQSNRDSNAGYVLNFWNETLVVRLGCGDISGKTRETRRNYLIHIYLYLIPSVIFIFITLLVT